MVIENIYNGKLEVVKITFGSEPKDYEVYDYLLNNWGNLKFSPPIESGKQRKLKINPKNMQRDIKKSLAQKGVGTKA